jgi:murein DD-endopeptidase MepM/ murein hydrolase activator NlpD
VTTRVSQGENGAAASGASAYPALSLDGNWVAFQSAATNLDPMLPALHAATQVYLHDRTAGKTMLISRGPDGRPGDGDSRLPALSGDGRTVVYVSAATNLVVGDTNAMDDIFLYDRITNTTRRISVASTGTQANRGSTWPTISLDGRLIAFVSEATNLVTGDGNAAADLFVYDQWARHTSRVSVAVVDRWRGRQASGPTLGPASLTVGGELIGLVAAADDLAPPGSAGVPRLFLHTHAAPPTFALSGQVVDTGRVPLADVAVFAGPHRAVTGPDGSFHLPYLVGGTYTLAVARPGYLFLPPRRTLSVLTDLAHQDFIGFPGANGDGWLDLPFAYDGEPSTFLALLRDTDEGGLVDAWFDHDAPTYAKNGAILLWDGRDRSAAPYHTNLGCFERRCYDGHDGVDFPYRDPDATTEVYEPITIYPAAAGRVAAVVTACGEGGRFCNRGYGNEVLLYHDNGHFTRYSHLDAVNVDAATGQLTRATPLGIMGSTGNSYGVHLHFAVHQDDGNGQWDGDQIDRPLDPFGWLGVELDPWAAAKGGPISRRLWRYSPSAEAVVAESQPATLRDGSGAVTANLPAGTFAGQVRVELSTGAAQALADPPRRSLGRGFRLQVLEALPAGSVPAPARPIEFAVAYVGAETRHLALDDLLLYAWQDGLGWSPLPTVVDTAAQVIYAASDRLGEFDLQAPLLCPADAHEPDDGYFAALGLTPGDPATARLFDLPDDEDWLQIEATAGTAYTVTTTSTAGVTLTTVLFDHDGLTRLAASTTDTLTWTAPADGTYFVRLTPAAGSATGCAAGYTVTLR